MLAQLDVFAVMALGAGPFMFMRGFRELRLRRLIRDTPTARIRSMAMGLVEVIGKVMARSTAIAPFSGHACVYWEVDIAVRNQRSSWAVIHRNQSGQPFYLSDGTGVALVYPRGAQSRVHYGSEEFFPGMSLPSCYAEYLREHPFALGPVARLGQMRFRERVIEEGQQVYVLGTAAPRAHEHVIADGEGMQATGTDDLVTRRLRTLDEEVTAVIRQGDNERTFVVSQTSERDLVFGLGWKANAWIVFGPLLTLFGLGYWLMAWSSGRAPR